MTGTLSGVYRGLGDDRHVQISDLGPDSISQPLVAQADAGRPFARELQLTSKGVPSRDASRRSARRKLAPVKLLRRTSKTRQLGHRVGYDSNLLMVGLTLKQAKMRGERTVSK